MGNILFRDTKIDDLSPERIKELGAAHIGDVSRGDGAPLDNGMPNYLVEPMEYHELAQGSRGHVGEIQLVDFGECKCCSNRSFSTSLMRKSVAFFVESPPKSVCTPMSLHPPELVFGHSLSKAVDIWNFGSTVRILKPSFQGSANVGLRYLSSLPDVRRSKLTLMTTL